MKIKINFKYLSWNKIFYNHFQEYLHTTEVLKTTILILLMEEN
jgi:hypothetical protein